MNNERLVDIAIIGGGPAGLTAGLYASRARLKTVLLERGLPGGQALTAEVIENYPGFPEGIKGPALAELFVAQASRAGLETIISGVHKLVIEKDAFTVIIDTGENIRARAVIVATGASWSPLGVPGEERLRGRGVSYCATCDGPLFRNKEIAVVGGGDTAVGDAIFLARFAKRVTVIHRRDVLRATKILQERLLATKNVTVRWNTIVTEITGEKKVEAVRLKDVASGASSELHLDGVFVLVGIKPNSELARGVVALDEAGSIIADEDMRTSVPGIFACGDVRRKALRQIVTACGEGAAAAYAAEQYIANLK